jgi:translation initiation factor eIF-2B subunit epsilon
MWLPAFHVLCCCSLQDGVVIGDNVTASHALLCEGVVVGAGATISPGVVLSYGVVVGPRHTVPAYAIVSLCKQLTTEVRSELHWQQLHAGVSAA